jgi:hypothetical protein
MGERSAWPPSGRTHSATMQVIEAEIGLGVRKDQRGAKPHMLDQPRVRALPQRHPRHQIDQPMARRIGIPHIAQHAGCAEWVAGL